MTACRTAGVLFLLAFLVGCQAKGVSGKKEPQAPIRIALEAEPLSLDPRLAMDAYSSKINELLYRGLFTYDATLTLVPDLLESYESLSTTRFRFRLKPGLTFHDGSPLVARDVVYTYDWVKDPAHASPHRDGFSIIRESRVLNDLEFEIELTAPFAPFLNRLTLGIIPRSHGDAPDFAENPVGSGPFKLTHWERGQYLRLERTQAAGAPVEFFILPDENLRLLELLHGRIDLVQNSISPSLLPVAARAPDITIDSAPGINLTYMGFKLDDPVLAHAGVRRAIAMAIDRQKLIAYQLGGYAVPAQGPLPPQH